MMLAVLIAFYILWTIDRSANEIDARSVGFLHRVRLSNNYVMNFLYAVFRKNKLQAEKRGFWFVISLHIFLVCLSVLPIYFPIFFLLIVLHCVCLFCFRVCLVLCCVLAMLPPWRNNVFIIYRSHCCR